MVRAASFGGGGDITLTACFLQQQQQQLSRICRAEHCLFFSPTRTEPTATKGLCVLHIVE
jgi:hypothetical protein